MSFLRIYTFKQPKPDTLAGPLLQACYNKVKVPVQAIFDASKHLGLLIDESNDITGTRVENISVMADGTSFR
jgi:hypothetical protein